MIEDRRGTCVAIALFLAVSVTPLALSAESRFELRGNLQAQNQNQGARQNMISRKRAAAIAQRATGGRVLSVELAGQRVYRVKVLLNNSRVRTVRVDAQTGELQL